jgi:hypothetical protein
MEKARIAVLVVIMLPKRIPLRTGECNHRSGIFGTAVSSFLGESDLALEEARSDPGVARS